MNSRALKQAELFVLLSIIFLLGVVTMDTKNGAKSIQSTLFDTRSLLLNAERERDTMKASLSQTQEALVANQTRLASIEDQLRVRSEALAKTQASLASKSERLLSTQSDLVQQTKMLQNTKDQLNTKVSLLDTTKTELSAKAASLEKTQKLLSGKNSELEDVKNLIVIQAEKLKDKTRQLNKLEEDLLKLGTPIFVFSEKKQEYSFKSGSAVVPNQLAKALKSEILPQLENRNANQAFNAIEVVGHTDDQAINKNESNLDDLMIDVYQGKSDFSKLRPGSNTDLGMMRALAIIRIIKESKDAGRLKNIKYFFPSSSGQIITSDHSIARSKANKNDGSRRRVEIRMLRYEPSNITTY